MMWYDGQKMNVCILLGQHEKEYCASRTEGVFSKDVAEHMGSK